MKSQVQDLAHRFVHFVADDLRDNTLTNAALIGTGIGKGGQLAFKGAKVGFTMLERHVARKTVIGGLSGGASSYIAGASGFGGNIGQKIAKVTDKITQLERKFDKTPLGKAIDDGITVGEKITNRAIDIGFGK